MQTKKSILIVDDDKDYVECLTIMLEAAGFDVSSASNATDCMTAVKRKKPDLIVLDIMMEKLVSGLHVGYELRADPDFKDIPIIMVSAILEETGFDVAAAKGTEYVAADEFLNKPVKPQVLLTTINRLIAKSTRRNPSP